MAEKRLGAAMAVEDAAALAEALSFIRHRSQIAQAVGIYEAVRVPRASAMHEASYRHAYTMHLPDGPEQEARDMAMLAEVEGSHFISSPSQWSDPATQLWAYDHNPNKAVREAWAQSEEGSTTPKM
jgi:salicylate hydroxylase